MGMSGPKTRNYWKARQIYMYDSYELLFIQRHNQ